jgi:hypothetical protein
VASAATSSARPAPLGVAGLARGGAGLRVEAHFARSHVEAAVDVVAGRREEEADHRARRIEHDDVLGGAGGSRREQEQAGQAEGRDGAGLHVRGSEKRGRSPYSENDTDGRTGLKARIVF